LYSNSYDVIWGAKVEGKPQQPRIGFSVFEAFSFLLDDGMAVWLPKNDESPHYDKHLG
jgi:hypothetical protein